MFRPSKARVLAMLDEARIRLLDVTTLEQYDSAHRRIAYLKDLLTRAI